MEALDGNAIAGALFEFFGCEMTMVSGTCAHCGAQAHIAELPVFSRAPGAVVRCRDCGNVVFVVVDRRGETRVELSAFRLLDPPRPPP